MSAATYGSGDRQRNCFDEIEELIKRGSLSVTVSNESMGGDPCYGTAKTLKITYLSDPILAAAGTLTKIKKKSKKALIWSDVTEPTVCTTATCLFAHCCGSNNHCWFIFAVETRRSPCRAHGK